ncbi:hypothetical protein LguiB_003858 [Lonicera macranthoides]
MSSSRDNSPDWLRSFQGPAQSALALSSDSEPPPDDSPLSEDEKDNQQDGGYSPFNESVRLKSLNAKAEVVSKAEKKRKRDCHSKREGDRDGGKNAKQETTDKPIEPRVANHSVLALSSDSESCPDTICPTEDNVEKEMDKDAVLIDTLNETPKIKSPKKRLKTEGDAPKLKKKVESHISRGTDGDPEVAEEETSAKHIGPYVSSSRLPLLLSEKVQRSKVLVECEGETIDLSGDVGAVGRVVISDNPSSSHEMMLDLKGTIYRTTIVPSRTFCVVSFGQSEAKIEAIMNDFIQLKPESNVYEAETMVEGTLEGFSFDSEDEAEKLPISHTNQTDQNEDADGQANGKPGGKAEKKSGAVRKKGKAATGKTLKKVKKKSQAPKKSKAKK